MSSPSIPTVEQLAEARTRQWHQNGEALLTFENLRSWINVAGLVLFTPRASQLPAPAPSLVEGVLGAAGAEPALAEMEQAKSLLARLVAEGIAVPLNLLGTPGETPDFVATAQVFSYIFTLRGDKAWKQPPATSGAVKVSPLAAATYEVLSKETALSAYDLTTRLGKEVTESAVMRALNELWAHLRVIPVGQSDGRATLWELTSARFTKHIKAGANAGQPSALSALISLYLGSAMLATEEQIETFLSPLAARSRIRDVIHALMGARELETLVVDGRTLLHVSGSLPAFAATAEDEGDVHAKPVETIDVEAGVVLAETDAPRIKKFVARPRKLGTGFPSDYGRKFSGAPLDRDRSAPRGRSDDRERRPFDKSTRPVRPAIRKPAFDKPAFDRPWDEARPAASAPDAGETAGEPGKRAYGRKPRIDGGEGQWALGSKPAFGRKPAFGSRAGAEARPPRREYTPRPDGEGAGPRKTYSKPGTFGRRREAAGDSRPPRQAFNERGSNSRDSDGSDRAARPTGRVFERSDRPDRPDRSDRPAGPARSSSARDGGGLAPRSAPRTPGSFSARPRPTFGTKPGTSRPAFTRGREGVTGTGDRPARPTFRKFDAPRGDRPARPRSAEGSQGRTDGPARPYSKSSSGGEKKPYSKPSAGGFGPKRPSGGGKPAGTFAKFADGKNPLRKPGKPGGKGNSYKGKKTGFGDQAAYRERKPKAGE